MSGQRDNPHGSGIIPVAEGQSSWQRDNPRDKLAEGTYA